MGEHESDNVQEDEGMILIEKKLATDSGEVVGGQLKWGTGWLFLVEAKAGLVVCGSFDVESFEIPAAKVVPPPGNPAYTLEEFVTRPITHVNKEAKEKGVLIGMNVLTAAALLN